MKSKRNDNIKNIKLTLIALIGAMLLSVQATAADTAQQGDDTKVNTPPAGAQDDKNNQVISDDLTALDTPPKKVRKSPIFAKVGSMSITWFDYENEYANESRKKFYHGKPSESAVATFQREIGDKLITNAMLVQEAKRRKLKPDNALVKQQLEQFEQRVAQNPKWPASRPRVLPIITARFQNENLRTKLEELVRNVPSPSKKQLRKYYDAHPEKFTSPPQQRVATILLRVDPSAPDADWQKAIEQGEGLVKRLRAGEDFAELARDYSGDVTAEDGGDMGYLHEGMLPGLPAETVSKLQPGETSDPVTLMEGVGIFRLIDRQQATTLSFKAAEQRARNLWRTEQSDNAWNSLIAKLKKNTSVQKDESHFFPLSPATKKPESMGTTKP